MTNTKKNPMMQILVKWLARVLSLLSIGVMLLFAFGEGLNLLRLSGEEAILFVLFPLGVSLGMLVAWWRELAGGILSVACFALFYVVHFILSGGLPRGPFFFLFTLPGLIFLISWMLSRRLENR